MKKRLAIILSLAVCVLSGCQAVEKPTAPSETVIQIHPTLETTGATPSEAPETILATEEMTQPPEASAIQKTDPRVTDETVLETTAPETRPSEETKPQETRPPATEPEETKLPATEELSPDHEPEVFVPDYAYKRQVASYVAKYINQYRSSPCIVLSGMSQVAQYRAGQLCYNFSHSTSDKRAALAYYEYGRWIDASEAGLDVSMSYYESDTSEAICRGVRGSDPESLGKAIATAIRNSDNHWSYIGSSEYSYIGVGVEYQDDAYGWYCCVMVGTVDHG